LVEKRVDRSDVVECDTLLVAISTGRRAGRVGGTDMSRVVPLPPLPDAETDAPLVVADDTTDQFWRLVLAYAVREGATSVHYHPWRSGLGGEDTLSCIIGETRFAMVPPDPDPEFTNQLLAAARRLATTGPVGRLRAWAAGGGVGRLRLVAAGEESEWCVVSWGSGEVAGVEFLRLSPLPALASSNGQEA
jgi:hypothetical protein